MTATSPEDLKLLVQLIRVLRGWDQLELGAAAGLDDSTISRYERGLLMPPAPTLERLVAAAGFPMWMVDAVLVPVLRVARRTKVGDALPAEGGPRTPGMAASAAAGAPATPAVDQAEGDEAGPRARLAAGMAAATEAALGFLVADLPSNAAELPNAAQNPSSLDRTEALDLWAQLEPCSSAERRWLVEQLEEFRSWALAEELAEQSRRAAADDAAVAADLAALAVRVAELTPGDERWRLRLRGFVTAYRANAWRVAGKVREAERTFAKAWDLWAKGATGDPAGLLPEWRLLDMEASLRREQGRYSAALRLLDRAQSMAPPEAGAHLLLNRVFALEQLGDVSGSLAALREAAPLVEHRAEPRERWMLAFHLTLNLFQLGRLDEAAVALPGLHQQAAALANDLDQLRVMWLSGRIAKAQGRSDAALAAFEQVRSEFVIRRNAAETALVTLELAVLYLEQGRTREVRELAAAMAWVFNAEGIRRELVAALRLFCEAAALEAATIDQVTRLIAAVHEARSPCRDV